MEIDKPYRKCPICNSKEARFVHKVEFVLFDNHPMAGGYNVVQCAKCLFIYADTRVKQQELDIYYKELSKYEDKNIGTGGGYSKNDKDRLLKTAEFISSYLPDKNARIIDLGCANGGLLKELKALQFNNVVGLDPSSQCVEITKNEVGCEAHQMSLFNIDESLGTFDLVILSHVLEHLLDLPSTIEKLNYLLKEGSLVYVECPNASNYNKVIHAPLQEFNTEHINHFTELSFENLFGLYGFQKIFTGDKVMKIGADQDYHAVYGLFKKTGGLFNYTLKPEKEIIDRISDYIFQSEKIFNAVLDKFSDLNPSESIALYGIGQFAFKLLSKLGLKKYNQVKLFDNNNLNVGKKIQGIEILAGKTIKTEYEKASFTIVITSLISEEAIRKQIVEEFKSSSVNLPPIIGFKDCLTGDTSIQKLFDRKEHYQLKELARFLKEDKPIVIFGAGNLGKKVAAFLVKESKNVIAFADNNQKVQGQKVLDFKIRHPEDFTAAELKNAIWIVSIWSPGNSFAAAKKQLHSLGVNNIFHAAALMQLFPDQLLPHYHFQTPDYFIRHQREINEVYENLADEESKRQFVAHLDCRINLNFEGLPEADTENQYFPSDVVSLTENEVFLDGGAYDGDTLKEFSTRTNNRFIKYIALEPDPVNYKKLQRVAASYEDGRVEVFPYAVGRENTILKFDATGGAGAGISESGTIEVNCKRVDDSFFDYKPTYIKFDIEGAELDGLKGAEKTIETYRPKLAVCIYHLPDDLWRIFLYLHKKFPFYNFFTRTHQYDGLDFVLYAIPK